MSTDDMVTHITVDILFWYHRYQLVMLVLFTRYAFVASVTEIRTHLSGLLVW